MKFYYFLGHEQFQPEMLVKHAVLAEEASFDGVMVSDHFHPWVDDESAGGFAWATLGAIAQATTTLELMTGVTAPLRRYHPAIVAQMAATVDRLSGGRFALGLGTGEALNEGPLGYEFPAYQERRARLKEAFEIIHQLLDGEKLTYQGSYYHTDRAKLYSPPTQRIPLWMSAKGPQSIQLAKEQADGLITSARIPVLEPTWFADWDKPLLIHEWTVMAATDDEAWEYLKPWRGLRTLKSIYKTDPQDLRVAADQEKKTDIARRFYRFASAEEFVAHFRPILTEVTPDIFTIQTTGKNQEALIKLLAEEVLPELRKS